MVKVISHFYNAFYPKGSQMTLQGIYRNLVTHQWGTAGSALSPSALQWCYTKI